MMAAGRDSLFKRKNTLFTERKHFYACENQIKPSLYPHSHDRNTAHQNYRTADTALIAPVHTKPNLFLISASNKTSELSA